MNFINGNKLRNKKTIKQCLVLCVAAYVTFTVLFEEMNDGGDDFFSLANRVVSSSRSLQEKVQTLDVNADHGTERSTTATAEVVVIITGKKKSFPLWRDRLNSISTSIDRGSISLLYGSTDEKIPQDACDNDLDLPCQTAFIPGTTWAEGHNVLVDEAIQKEVRMNKKYDYWLFLDDNVEANCSEGEWATEDSSSLSEGSSSCWEKIFNFITSDQVPKNSSTITLPLKKGQWGSVRLIAPATEVWFAAFKRDHITHLLRSWNRSGYYVKFKILRNQSK